MTPKHEASMTDPKAVVEAVGRAITTAYNRETGKVLIKDFADTLARAALERAQLEAERSRPSAEVAFSDLDIKHMVQRFLGWKLPEDFRPDGGVTFKAEFNKHTAHPMRHQPTGTNLLDARQAEAMVRHIVAGLWPSHVSPSSEGESRESELLDRVARAWGLLWASMADGHTRSGQNVQSARRVLGSLLTQESKRGGIAMLSDDERLGPEDTLAALTATPRQEEAGDAPYEPTDAEIREGESLDTISYVIRRGETDQQAFERAARAEIVRLRQQIAMLSKAPPPPKGYEGELVERIEARLAEPLEGRTGDAWERGRRAGLREALEIGRGA